MKTLTARDLMIGDWVGARCPAFDMSQDFHIFKYDGSNDLVNKGYILEPIPITPKILEGNGFVEADANGQCLHLEIDTCNYVEYFPKSKILQLESTSSSLCMENINSVHELQHAWKLCGIDMEVIL